ncbi:MAG: histone H1 [Balneolia bacterium]|nr:histone H1 [Balneolia bacterium]
MSRFHEVKSLVDSLEEDMDKFYAKGNKTAGTRARKTLQDLKKLAQEIRIDIQDKKNEE